MRAEHARGPLFLSPPLPLRERGIKGVRVPRWGWGGVSPTVTSTPTPSRHSRLLSGIHPFLLPSIELEARTGAVHLCGPLFLDGPKGEGDQGGEGSPVGLGRCPPKCDIEPLDPTRTPVLISPPFEHQPNYLKEEPKTQGSPPGPTRGLNAQAHPNGPYTGPAAQAKVAISSSPPGPVPLP